MNTFLNEFTSASGVIRRYIETDDLGTPKSLSIERFDRVDSSIKLESKSHDLKQFTEINGVLRTNIHRDNFDIAVKESELSKLSTLRFFPIGSIKVGDWLIISAYAVTSKNSQKADAEKQRLIQSCTPQPRSPAHQPTI